MKYLLDTSTFLWYVTANNNLSANARELIRHPANKSDVSLTSVWEMAIKSKTGKLDIPLPFAEYIDIALLKNSFQASRHSIGSLKQVADMPLMHRDPSTDCSLPVPR